jgi:hypothetical protein
MTETNTASRNAAILLCCQAEKRSRRESRSKGRDIVETQICADEAYRKALPELVGYENIRDFIACVTHGMVIGTVTAFQADKLLNGARLALSALRQQPTDLRKNKKGESKLPGREETPDPQTPQKPPLSVMISSD